MQKKKLLKMLQLSLKDSIKGTDTDEIKEKTQDL